MYFREGRNSYPSAFCSEVQNREGHRRESSYISRMGKTTLDLLPFANICTELGWSYIVSGSAWPLHCTWRCWQAQLLSTARSEQFHTNPPMRFCFSRLLLIGFFQIFPDCLPPTTAQRTLLCLIHQTVNVINYWPRKQNKQFHPRSQITTHALFINFINPASRIRNTSEPQNYGAANTLWSCATCSSNAKKSIAPCSVCAITTGFQINQLLVKTGQEQPTKASLSCFSTIRRHDRDRGLTGNRFKPRQGRMQAQLPLSHYHPKILSGS